MTVQPIDTLKGFFEGGDVPTQSNFTDLIDSTYNTTLKSFGAVGDGVTDDTAAIQAALNYGTSRVVVGSPGDVYLCDDQLIVQSNTVWIGNGSTLKRNFLGNKGGANASGFFVENATAHTTNDDSNIWLIDLKITDNGDSTRGGHLAMVGVNGLRIEGLNIVGTAAYDAVNGAWACYISGTDITMSDVFIDTTLGTTWADGIHLGYVNGFSLSNFVILAGDDALALQFVPSSWSNSGVALASSGVSIGNGVVSSEIANAIRIGAASTALEGSDAAAASVWKNVILHDIASIKTATTGTHLAIDDLRASAKISAQHDDIAVRNLTMLSASTSGLIKIRGNPDINNSANYLQHNWGRVTLSGITAENTSTGATLQAGGIDKLTIENSTFERTAASATQDLILRQITDIRIANVYWKSLGTGATTVAQIFYAENVDFSDFTLLGSTAEFALMNIATNADITTNVRIVDGALGDAARLLTNSGGVSFGDFIVAGTDFRNGPTTKLAPVTATRYRAVFADELVSSDGSTGGAGSAGTGNQYVELTVGSNTYKILHDGTV